NDAIAARNADHIKGRASGEGACRHQAESAIARHGCAGFGNDMRCRLRQPRQDLLRPREFELRQSGEDDKPEFAMKEIFTYTNPRPIRAIADVAEILKLAEWRGLRAHLRCGKSHWLGEKR